MENTGEEIITELITKFYFMIYHSASTVILKKKETKIFKIRETQILTYLLGPLAYVLLYQGFQTQGPLTT